MWFTKNVQGNSQDREYRCPEIMELLIYHIELLDKRILDVMQIYIAHYS